MNEFWQCRDGRKLLVEDMEHAHVLSCLNLMVSKFPVTFKHFKPSPEAIANPEIAKRGLCKLINMVRELNTVDEHCYPHNGHLSDWDWYWSKKDY